MYCKKRCTTIQILKKLFKRSYLKKYYMFLENLQYVCWSYKYLQAIVSFCKILNISFDMAKIIFKVQLFL